MAHGARLWSAHRINLVSSALTVDPFRVRMHLRGLESSWAAGRRPGPERRARASFVAGRLVRGSHPDFVALVQPFGDDVVMRLKVMWLLDLQVLVRQGLDGIF